MVKCEDWPCCGHEAGDCDGSLYGSDASIKKAVYDRWDMWRGWADEGDTNDSKGQA